MSLLTTSADPNHVSRSPRDRKGGCVSRPFSNFIGEIVMWWWRGTQSYAGDCFARYVSLQRTPLCSLKKSSPKCHFPIALPLLIRFWLIRWLGLVEQTVFILAATCTCHPVLKWELMECKPVDSCRPSAKEGKLTTKIWAWMSIHTYLNLITGQIRVGLAE